MRGERLENRLGRVLAKLKQRRKVEAARMVVGVASGLAAGVSSALLPNPLGSVLPLPLFIAGYVVAHLATRKWPEASPVRGFIAYSAVFLLVWFSVYASFIQ